MSHKFVSIYSFRYLFLPLLLFHFVIKIGNLARILQDVHIMNYFLQTLDLSLWNENRYNYDTVVKFSKIQSTTTVCILIRTASFPRFWGNQPYFRNKWYLIWRSCLFLLRRSKKIFWVGHFEFLFLKKKIFFASSHRKQAAPPYEVSFFSTL